MNRRAFEFLMNDVAQRALEPHFGSFIPRKFHYGLWLLAVARINLSNRHPSSYRCEWLQAVSWSGIGNMLRGARCIVCGVSAASDGDALGNCGKFSQFGHEPAHCFHRVAGYLAYFDFRRRMGQQHAHCRYAHMGYTHDDLCVVGQLCQQCRLRRRIVNVQFGGQCQVRKLQQ